MRSELKEATLGFLENLKIYNVESGECMKDLIGHTSQVTTVSWSPDGDYIASGSGDKSIRIWDTQSWECIRTFTPHKNLVECVTWSPDGSKLASGAWDDTINIWETDSWESKYTITKTNFHISGLSWSPDNTNLAAYFSNDIWIWNTSEEEFVKKLERRGVTLITSISWSPDGRFIAAGDSDANITIFGTNSWNSLEKLEGHSEHVDCLAWSKDSTLLVSGCDDYTIKVWDIDVEDEPKEASEASERYVWIGVFLIIIVMIFIIAVSITLLVVFKIYPALHNRSRGIPEESKNGRRRNSKPCPSCGRRMNVRDILCQNCRYNNRNR